MARRMGWDFGLEKSGLCFKRKFRWLLKIPGVSAEGVNTLPPMKSARPSLSFKEVEVRHLNEDIYFPGRPEWKPISLSLYDIKKQENKIFQWLQLVYDSCQGTLELYDGCGNVLETWVYENAWPNAIEWGELDMANNEITTIDLTLRYDRAFIEEEC
jgi:hypothetical protein